MRSLSLLLVTYSWVNTLHLKIPTRYREPKDYYNSSTATLCSAHLLLYVCACGGNISYATPVGSSKKEWCASICSSIF